VVRNIRVGTASVNWGFDPYYTWVQTPPFTQMLDEMVQAGYEGTEISYNFPGDASEIRTELQQRNLAPAATFHAVNVRDTSRHQSAIDSSMRVADRLQELGSEVLILSDQVSQERIRVAGRASSADELSGGAWQAMADGLNKIGDRLASRGMRAVFHPHAGTYVETRAEIDRLCELTDPALLGLCPDTGHLAYAGASPEGVFADYASRIGYVHLKDVDPSKLDRVRAEHIDFVEGVRLGLFVELGRGMVSIPNIIDALRSAGYSGWIIVEQDAPPEPFKSAKDNRVYLREQFAL
jgi:inosose dehydratase